MTLIDQSKFVPGVNIQWPWSKLILEGKKTVETRSYTLPSHYIGIDLAVIETPGPMGSKNGISKAQIVGIVRFGQPFEYTSEANWIADSSRHLVPVGDPNFGWSQVKPKWGWPIEKFQRIKSRPPPKIRGHVFARACIIR